MFWIGLIVGIVVGIIGNVLFALKIANMSLDEAAECGCLMIEAGQNRESMIVVRNDDGELGRVVLEEN